MAEELKVFISDLEAGSVAHIDAVIDPSFMELQEEDLAFRAAVRVAGDVYLAGDELIIRLSADTEASMPCKVCNGEAIVPVHVEQLYLTQPKSDIVNGQLDCTDYVRESLMLELPAFAECRGGQCPQRSQLEEYLAKPDGEKTDMRSPFADLVLEVETSDD
ncbi:MAG: hypothetical protein KDK78_11550 [Chlamydiia bacterium]|nr:hypothetical protein [Chlamydiia bacterium]